MSNQLKLAMTVKINDDVYTVGGTTALVLSGDRRRWPKQLREQVGQQVEFLAKRFEAVSLDG